MFKVLRYMQALLHLSALLKVNSSAPVKWSPTKKFHQNILLKCPKLQDQIFAQFTWYSLKGSSGKYMNASQKSCHIYGGCLLTLRHIQIHKYSILIQLLPGYETLQLHSLQQPLEPGQGYSLPEWAQGTWGDSVVVKGGAVTYAREEDFTRYAITIVSTITITMTRYTLHAVSSPRSNHFLVRLDTSCSPPAYACLALHLR